MQYHAIPCKTIQYHAIPGNTMQYNAIPCNAMQYHASLITADGVYHCPVGSILAIFTYSLVLGGTFYLFLCYHISSLARCCLILLVPCAGCFVTGASEILNFTSPCMVNCSWTRIGTHNKQSFSI